MQDKPYATLMVLTRFLYSLIFFHHKDTHRGFELHCVYVHRNIEREKKPTSCRFFFSDFFYYTHLQLACIQSNLFMCCVCVVGFGVSTSESIFQNMSDCFHHRDSIFSTNVSYWLSNFFFTLLLWLLLTHCVCLFGFNYISPEIINQTLIPISF